MILSNTAGASFCARPMIKHAKKYSHQDSYLRYDLSNKQKFSSSSLFHFFHSLKIKNLNLKVVKKFSNLKFDSEIKSILVLNLGLHCLKVFEQAVPIFVTQKGLCRISPHKIGGNRKQLELKSGPDKVDKIFHAFVG